MDGLIIRLFIYRTLRVSIITDTLKPFIKKHALKVEPFLFTVVIIIGDVSTVIV